MKKIVRFTIFGVVVALTFSNAIIFAQEKWQLQSLNLQIPLTVTYSATGHNDTSKKVIMSFSSSFANPPGGMMITVGDSSFNVWTTSGGDGGNGGYLYEYGFGNMHFIDNAGDGSLINLFLVDSISGFSISNTNHPPYTDYFSGAQKNSINFFKLKYDVQLVSVDTTIIKIKQTGALCKKLIEQAYYTSSFNDSWQDKYSHSYNDNGSAIGLSDDTSSYICEIVFLVNNFPSNVQSVKSDIPSLITSTSLPDHTIHFSFPSSDHRQQMTIYDILGREISRIEIPAGSSSYVMPSDCYPKGAFFARLGNLGAKFVVDMK
jgi:hypothetical protein